MSRWFSFFRLGGYVWGDMLVVSWRVGDWIKGGSYSQPNPILSQNYLVIPNGFGDVNRPLKPERVILLESSRCRVDIKWCLCCSQVEIGQHDLPWRLPKICGAAGFGFQGEVQRTVVGWIWLKRIFFWNGFCRGHSNTHFGVIKQCECKCMVTSRHFPYNSALFGLAI